MTPGELSNRHYQRRYYELIRKVRVISKHIDTVITVADYELLIARGEG